MLTYRQKSAKQSIAMKTKQITRHSADIGAAVRLNFNI